MRIYRHIYDEPMLEGKKKENKFLGNFKIVETISGDVNNYSFECVGIKNGKRYLITGVEIVSSGSVRNAGTMVFAELIEKK